MRIKREFAAEPEMVWEAWVDAEMLDRWWVPKPFTSRTIAMDFSTGGRRFYAMVSSEGVEISWQVQHYTAIEPWTHLQFLSTFADRKERLQPPGSDRKLSFIATSLPRLLKSIFTINRVNGWSG